MIIHFIEVKSLLDEFNILIDNSQNIAIMTRDITLQTKEIETLAAFCKKSEELKKTNREKYSEDELNLILCLIFSAKAIKKEISMLVNLKLGKPSYAWSELIEAQNLISSVARNHPFSDGEYLNGFASKLQAYEKLLFPNMNFYSPGSIIKKTRCNICGKAYEKCQHIKGKMYSGELCVREIHEAELLEISSVENPANKLARDISIELNGKTVDSLTLLPKKK